MHDWYVYIWFNDEWGKVPIYVGKGKGNRYSSTQARSAAFIKHIERWKCHSEIIFDDLSEDEAMRFEKYLKDGFIKNGLPILDAEAHYRGKLAQAEGIAAMPVVDGKRVSAKTGRGFGRPCADIDNELFKNLAEKQKDGILTVADCCRELGISRATWYQKLKLVPSASLPSAL